jgi:LDH2 family malate/lactate/ureidoglycolate dehydrogenase
MSSDLAAMAQWSRDLLISAGLDEDAADAVVCTLVYAEQRGFASHGFMRLPIYVSRVQAGGINRHANVQVLNDQAGLAIVDADAAAGAFSALACVKLAMQRARIAGAGVVIARNANHFGSAGYFTDLMAAEGFLGIAVCNTDPWMCAPFGGRPVLGTNPIAAAVPVTGDGGPRLDMATSEAAHGKLIGASNRGEAIPLGWAVDVDGNPTDDPDRGLAGALLPSGGPKGFGLAFIVDCLLAVGGARTSDHAGPLYGDPTKPQELGHAFIAIRVDAVQSTGEYSERIAALSSAVHQSGIPGSGRRPMIPGEPERERLVAASNWVVDAGTLRSFEDLSREVDATIPDVIANRLAQTAPITKEKQ